MLLVGTCNPKGEESTYNGLYLTENELSTMATNGSLRGVPVKTEHKGSNVGKVVSGFVDARGCLQCVMEIDESSLEGALVSGFIKDGVASELSLGYSVDVQHTDNNKLKAGHKELLEISIVRKGARDGCYISAYQEPGKPVVYKQTEDAWAGFDLT